MKRSPKIPRQSVVGIEIGDTSMRYVVMVPHPKVGYMVGTWGEQAIAFDAVADGEIIEFSPVASAARTLKAKTGVSRACFTSLGDDHRDARFREALQVGGFHEVIVMPTSESLDILTRDVSGASVPIIYFESPDELVCLYAGKEIDRYFYPLAIYAIEGLREYIENHDAEMYRVLGNFGMSSESMMAELAEYRVPAHPANVWRNVSNLSLYIPPILHEDSFAQAVCIANAYAMLDGEYDESHMPEVSGATFSPDTTTAGSSTSAFGRWFETGQGIIHPSAQEAATRDTAQDTTVEEEQDTAQETAEVSKTNTPSNSS
jgi:hypothetical protein